jgi:type IV secretory pathway VirB10-like protein
MKLLRVISLAAALLPALACAQWLWIDKDGRKVFSDRSPPSDIPAKNILKQPGMKSAPVPSEAQEPAPAASATLAKAAADGPKISGKDKALEEKKKQADAEEQARKKAEEEKFAREKAQNCERAKRSLKALNSGERIRAPNAKGELEFMSDETRANEAKRVEGIANECKG